MAKSRKLLVCAAMTAVLVFALALVGCGSAGSAPAATVNGTVIPESKVTEEVQSFRTSMELADEDSWGRWLAESGYTPESYREEVLDGLVEDEVLAQAAAQEGVSVDQKELDEYMDSIRAMYEDEEEWKQLLEDSGMTEEQYRADIEASFLQEDLQEKVTPSNGEVTDEEILEYYKENRDYYDDARRSSTILFAEDEEDLAEQVLAQIKSGEITFADAAKQHSVDSETADNGGDVGWDVLSSQGEDYNSILADLEPGQMSDVVTTEAGPQIILCTEYFEGPSDDEVTVALIPEAMVEEIRESVAMLASSDAFEGWLENYKSSLSIDIKDMPEGLPYAVDMTKYEQYASTEDGEESASLDELEGELLEDDSALEGSSAEE